jgi:hypothetical protein
MGFMGVTLDNIPLISSYTEMRLLSARQGSQGKTMRILLQLDQFRLQQLKH